MMNIVVGTQHLVALRYLMYTSAVTNNLISIAQAERNRSLVWVDDNSSSATNSWMDLRHKPSIDVEMRGFERREELYEAVTRVCSNLALVANTDSVDMCHRRLGNSSFEVLRKLVEYGNGVSGSGFENVGESKACELEKLAKAASNSTSYEDPEVAKPLGRVLLDLASPMKYRSFGRRSYFVTLLDSCSGYSLV